jgi:hypothetical protein
MVMTCLLTSITDVLLVFMTSVICFNNHSAIYSIISSGDEWEQGRHKHATPTYDLLLNLRLKEKISNQASHKSKKLFT